MEKRRPMPLLLQHHTHSTGQAVRLVEADCIELGGGEFDIFFRIHGDIENVVVPSRKPATRQDELWRTTCFEVFIASGDGYWEFNFSPSSEWAAYRFADYRKAREIETRTVIRQCDLQQDESVLDMHIVASLFSPDTNQKSYRLGLSAVIEEAGGAISYWALAHPTGKPDFHHKECFTIERLKATNS